MSKKLNKEEMRLKLIAIFKESGSFFQMKEIETEGRNKGISQKDVKEIMSSLTSEEIIKTSCIGNTNFYWLESLQIKLDEKRDKLKELKEKYKQVKELRDNLKEKAKMVESKEEESDKIKRQNLQDEVKNLKTKEKELRDKISALKNWLNSEDGKAIEEKIQVRLIYEIIS